VSAYPDGVRARNAWVLARRGPKSALDPFTPYAVLREEEIGADGRLVPTAVILITNRECPLKCVFCDLWRNTLADPVPPGAIAAQIRAALAEVPDAVQVKLYNAGSFFDPNAIPPDDYGDIVRELGKVERVIVECHPAFLGERARRFRDALDGRTLEVAIGLETIQPGVLERLNKGMTLDSFVQSAEFLDREGMSLRVFLMLRPPFTTEEEGIEWACRSIDFAVESGATACTVIPTRGGNGAMEALGDAFSPPDIRSLEQVIDYGVGRGRMRVFADLWDVERMFVCACGPARAERLARMNLEQRVSPEVPCRACRPAQGTNREG